VITHPPRTSDLPLHTLRQLSMRQMELDETASYLYDQAHRASIANGSTIEEELDESPAFIDVHVPAVEGHHSCWMFKKISILLEIDDAGSVTESVHWRCLHCRRLAPWPISLTTQVLAAHAHQTDLHDCD